MDKQSKILERLRSIEGSMKSQKSVLTLKEAAEFMGLSQSYLYKLTSKCKLPFYKPSGKMIYFNKEELENWLLRNKSNSENEIDVITSTNSFISRKI